MQNIEGSIVISIRAKAACRADEGRLVLAASIVHGSAARTRLRGVHLSLACYNTAVLEAASSCMARRINRGIGVAQRCSICGEPGHKASRHKQGEMKKCGSCAAEKRVDDFYTVARKDGTRRVLSICKDCDGKKGAVYRNGVPGRLVCLLITARRRAKIHSFDFNLTKKHITELYRAQNGLCALSGRTLSAVSGPDLISLDRINSSLGYVQGNVELTTWRVNCMKSNMSNDDFIAACRDVASLASDRGAAQGQDSIQDGRRLRIEERLLPARRWA